MKSGLKKNRHFLVLLLMSTMANNINATSMSAVDFNMTVRLKEVKFTNTDQPAEEFFDYEADDNVESFSDFQTHYFGSASGNGSGLTTLDGLPLTDTEILLLNSDMGISVYSESSTFGVGGIGRREQFEEVYFSFINWTTTDLTMVFDYQANFDMTLSNASQGDQATGLISSIVRIDNGIGAIQSIDLFPEGNPSEAIFFSTFDTGEIRPDGVRNGTFEFNLEATTGYAGITIETHAISDPRINSEVPLPASFWLMASSLLWFAGFGIRVKPTRNSDQNENPSREPISALLSCPRTKNPG